VSIGIGFWYYLTNIGTSDWQCIDTSLGGIPLYSVGRISKGDAECMYEEGQVGCSSIMAPIESENEYDLKSAKDDCKNYIDNYPNVTLKTGQKLNLKPYKCGKSGENYKLWNNTGYDDPDEDCYKIKNNVNVFEKYINQIKQQFLVPASK